MLPQTERAPPRRRRASSATPSAAAADRGERSERGERGERAEQADAAIELGPLSRLLGYHVAQAAVVAYARFEQHLGKPFELRKVEFSLLMLLQANGALTPGQLARTLMLGAPTLSMLLDRLQARALLRREPNPTTAARSTSCSRPRGGGLRRPAPRPPSRWSASCRSGCHRPSTRC